MSFPPGVKCWTPDGQDLGIRLRALDGTSNISGDEGRSYNVGEDRTVVVHSKDVAPLTAGGKFERVEDTSADKVTVRSYTASDLDGLTSPEAFQKFVIRPVAEAFQKFMFERGGLPGEDFLKDGSLFGPLLKHGRLGGIGSSLWPVDLDKLISGGCGNKGVPKKPQLNHNESSN